MIFNISEYKESQETVLINNWLNSTERKRLLDLKSYADGDNPAITDRKKMIYSEESGGLVVNPYAVNYKSKYNFYDQILSQKVNALCSETPLIDDVEDRIRKVMGFANKNAAYIASMQGYAFMFVGMNDQFVVFDTENVLAYADDLGVLKVVLRVWQKTINNATVTFYERYNEKGLQTFKYGGGVTGIQEVTKLIPYKFKKRESEVNTEYFTEDIGALPIVIFKNNKNMLPDMNSAIKNKIDILDVIESDLYNNIQEFSDIWLSVSADVDQETAQKIKDSLRKSKTMVANDGTLDIKTLEIPYQARAMAISQLKQDLVEDAGIIDFKEINGQATATEINARTYKLKQKVSDFEWFADEFLTTAVSIWQKYKGLSFDINITFQKLFIKNNNEIVNIANSVADRISKRAYLKLLQQANVIEDVDEELLEESKEALDRFDVMEVNDESGQSTQPNGDNIVADEAVE